MKNKGGKTPNVAVAGSGNRTVMPWHIMSLCLPLVPCFFIVIFIQNLYALTVMTKYVHNIKWPG